MFNSNRGLATEYKSKGIIVQSLCPFFVSTKLAGVRRSLTTPSPDEFVNSSIKTIGSQNITNGCLIHNIQVKSLINFQGLYLYIHILNFIGLAC